MGRIVSGWETLRIARRALASDRLRTLLTLLGIVIGVATVIAMGALVNGFERSFRRGLQSFSNNTIYVRTFKPTVMFTREIPDSLRRRRGFTPEDAEALRANAPAVRAVSVVKAAFGRIRITHAGRETYATETFGSDERLLEVRGFEVAQGRFLTGEEVRRHSNVVVLGKATRVALYGDGSAIGRTVNLDGIPFTVVGEFRGVGEFLYHNLDEMACVPWTTVDKYWAPPPHSPPWYSRRGEAFLDATPVDPKRMNEAMEQIREVLRERRHVPADHADDFELFSDDVFMTLYRTITGGIVWVMMTVSSISLLVGGIGVMNIMLVAVTERAHEIGLRKAVGATRRSILAQFLIEAMILSSIGGAVGILLGYAVSAAIGAFSGLPTWVGPGSILAAVGVSTAVGLLSGLYPAFRAARLDPVASLRNE